MQIERSAPEGSVECRCTMSELATTWSTEASAAGRLTLAEVGETALLEQLVEIARAAQPAGAAVEFGDDAAVWTPPAARDLAVSIDALVEGVDFRRSWIGPRQLGRRAFAVAASDLAASGADGVHCVATVCARADERVQDILELHRGLCEAAAAAGCPVIGGDVSAIDGPMVIDVCVTGSVPSGTALRRSAGRAGDALLVTGVLGRAAAGLRMLLEEGEPQSEVGQAWIDAQVQPTARLAEGREMVARGVRCGGDLSDGLAVDAGRTARACGCGVELWRDCLPIDAELSLRFGDEWLELAVSGGEDFELLIAVPQPDVEALVHAWPAELAPLTRVGTLVEGAGVRLLDAPGGAVLPVPQSRAGHFS